MEKRADMEKPKKNMGIELFRILCMLGIISYHLIGHGWIIQQLSPTSWKYALIQGLEAICLCGITGFALISGYVGVKGQTRYAAWGIQWLKVWLYSVGFTLLARWLEPGLVSREAMVSSCFPLLSRQYWYFSAYTGCMFMSPFLKSGLLQMEKKRATVGVVLMLAAFSAASVLSRQNAFDIGNGKNVLWLMVMYVLGAYLRTFGILDGISTGRLAGLTAGAACLQIACAFASERQVYAPTTVLLSVLLLLLCARVPVKRGARVISCWGAASFGVYLIHDHPYVRQMTIARYARYLACVPKLWLIPAIVLTAVGVYACCACVESVRARLFDRMGLKKRLYRLEETWMKAP